MSNFDFANDSILEMYLFESTTLLDQLDDILLQSEKEDILSTENINEIFRIMHTIKGSSAMMEFDTISHVSHKLEDLFFIIRDNGISKEYFHQLFDLVLKVSDFLKDEVEKIQQNKELSTENSSLINSIHSLIEKLSGQPFTEGSTEFDNDEALTQTADIPDNYNLYYLHINFSADCQMENIRAFMLVNKLEPYGKILTTIPSDLNTNKDASSIISKDGFYLSFATELSKIEIEPIVKGTLSVSEVRFLDALPSDDKKESPSQNQNNREPGFSDSKLESNSSSNSDSNSNSNSNSDLNKSKSSKQNLINVDLNKLNTLMDLVGEILIN